MKELLAVLLALATLAARAQTLELGNVKLTLGMSKTEVFKQAGGVYDMSKQPTVLFSRPDDLPDNEVLTISRVRYRDGDKCESPARDCFADVEFSNSRLTYASRSLYTAGTPERTLSEVIGSIVTAFHLSPNEIKPMNCETFHWLEHDDSGIARESVDITCAGHTVSISTSPFEGHPTGSISESIGKLKTQKRVR